ncbi:MAG: hypothetical protein JW951_04265 [Lentisphaerae bacterium]|nr:hypothetical protein [Lentisphaerota bacterium]
MNTPLSHRERVRLALAHRETDRVPIGMVCAGINPPARRALEKHLQAVRGLGVDAYLKPLIDIRTVGPEYVGPVRAPNESIWGVVRKAVTYGEGSYDEIAHYPLGAAETPDDLDAHTWPSTDWFDYRVLPERIRAVNADGGPYAIMALNCNVFETAWYMRGFEQAFMDLALNPALFGRIMQRVTDFYVAHARRTLEAARGAIDIIFTADDIGQQQGLLMGLDMWAEHIKPHHVRINDVIHAYGAKSVYHTDGAVMEAVPGLIEMGIDALQALQFDAAGMDAEALKSSYGDRLCFVGGISVQSTLPFGSVDDVRRETEERIRVLGRRGGYILGPSHAIQAGTPPENILALFDTAAASRP